MFGRRALTALATVAVLGALVTAMGAGLAGARPAGGGAAAARPLPRLLTGWYAKYLVRPTSIYYTGDGSGVVGKLRPHGGLTGPGRGSLHWGLWGAGTASGNGTVWLKLGTPTATSPFTKFAVTVSATRVRNGHFTRMTLRYTLHGQKVTDTRCVPDRGRVGEWGFAMDGKCQ